MDRDPRVDPRPGDRWRDGWGVRTVREVTPAADCIEFVDGEGMPFADFRWTTAPGRWTFVGVADAG